ncbi:hypothetical protein [Aquimarina macrocephali]|uniref:hypothetical protein n=1 Tax=Aquimarina macrocephali TaxID=666563 RepID=UPI003F6735A9
MPTLEQRIAKLEQVILNGLSTPQLSKLATVENNASFPFYSPNESKLVRIEYSDLINLIGSGGVEFEQELEADNTTPTGRILIKQNGVTKVVIGKVGQSSQYADLQGKPDFATEDYVNNSYNTLLNVLNVTTKYKGNFDVSVSTPVLTDASGTIGHEYKVIGAAPTGTVFNFGSGDITLKNDDIIAHNGTVWFKKVNNNQDVDLSNYQLLSEKGIANGYAPLDGDNKIPTSHIPSLAINDFITATETSILDFSTNSANYTFQQGDIIILSSGSGSQYFYKSGTKTDINNYSLITVSIPTLSAVLSEGNSANAKISDVIDPTDPQDVGTKNYIDQLVNNLSTNGSFTPTIIDAGGGATYNAISAFGNYYKIGNLTQIRILITIGSTTGTATGNIQIGGIPFLATGGIQILNLGRFRGSGYSSSDVSRLYPVITSIAGPAAIINIGFKDANVTASSNFTNGEIEITGVYRSAP